MSTPAVPAAPAATASASTPTKPSDTAMIKAATLALMAQKPLYFDFWETSLTKEAYIGMVKDSNPAIRFLACGEDEETTNAVRMLSAGDVILVETENSVYIVHKDIPRKFVKRE